MAMPMIDWILQLVFGAIGGAIAAVLVIALM